MEAGKGRAHDWAWEKTVRECPFNAGSLGVAVCPIHSGSPVSGPQQMLVMIMAMTAVSTER